MSARQTALQRSPLLLAFAAVALLGAGAAHAVPETFVDDGFNSGTSGWQVTHFSSIQPAIAATDAGGRVNIAAGAYPISTTLLIQKALTLSGPQADVDPRPVAGTTRSPGNAAEAVLNGNNLIDVLLNIDADNVTINGLEFRNGTADLILSPLASGPHNSVRFAYNIVSGSTGDEGIQLRNAPGCVIEYNRVFNTAGDGINASQGCDNGFIRFNELHDIASTNAAIYVYDDNTFNRDLNITIEGNTIRNSFVDDGIRIGSNGGVDADLAGGWILNNTIFDIGDDGIAVSASGVTIAGNEIYQVFGRAGDLNGAIHIDRPVGDLLIVANIIRDNTLAGANSAGVLLHPMANASTIRISCNTISGNTPFGVNNRSAGLLDATGNYWGAVDGPDDDAGLINGSGDRVSLNVDASGFAVEPQSVVPQVFVDDDFDMNSPGWGVTAFDNIQEAHDALCFAGRVIVAPGFYPVATPILITRPVQIIGPQADVDPRPSFGTTRTPGSADEAIVDGGSAIAVLLQFQTSGASVNGLEFRNGFGDLIESPIAGGPWNEIVLSHNIVHEASDDEAIQLRNAPDCLIYRNFVFNTGGDGIAASQGSDRPVIRENELTSIGTVDGAIYVYDNNAFNRDIDALIEGNLIRNVAVSDAIKLGSKDGDDTNLAGGVVRGNTIFSIADDGIVVACRDTMVEGNDVRMVSGTGIGPNGAVHVERPVQGVTIVGNTIRNNALNGPNSAGILLPPAAPAAGYDISCNTISGNTPYGLFNQSTSIANAENNFWGDASGPNDDDGLIGGAGDRISTNVDADPFLTIVGGDGPSFDAATLTFGPIAGDATEEMALVATNDSACVEIQIPAPGLVLSGSNADNFAVVSSHDFPLTLAPGESVAFTLRYDPQSEFATTHAATATLAGAFTAAPAADLFGSAFGAPNSLAIVADDPLVVVEGGSATFTVALTAAPLNPVEVTVAFNGGDADLFVQSGATLTFTNANFDQPQTVTIGASDDADTTDGMASFSVSAAGPELTEETFVDAVESDIDLETTNGVAVR